MTASNNRIKLSEDTIAKWAAKALGITSSDIGDILDEVMGAMNVDALNILPDRFNVRGLPYAFSSKSPLIPILAEMACDAESHGEDSFSVLVSDAAMPGAKSIFMLDVLFSGDESADCVSEVEELMNDAVLDMKIDDTSAVMFTVPPVKKAGKCYGIIARHLASRDRLTT